MKTIIIFFIFFLLFTPTLLNSQVHIGIAIGLPELLALRLNFAREFFCGGQLTAFYIVRAAIIRGDLRLNSFPSGNFLAYGFIGSMNFIPLDESDPEGVFQSLLDFGVGAEWGKNWVIGLEGGLGFELYVSPEPVEESDTIAFFLNLNISKKIL
jgi:hypothetical protein